MTSEDQVWHYNSCTISRGDVSIHVARYRVSSRIRDATPAGSTRIHIAPPGKAVGYMMHHQWEAIWIHVALPGKVV